MPCHPKRPSLLTHSLSYSPTGDDAFPCGYNSAAGSPLGSLFPMPFQPPSLTFPHSSLKPALYYITPLLTRPRLYLSELTDRARPRLVNLPPLLFQAAYQILPNPFPSVVTTATVTATIPASALAMASIAAEATAGAATTIISPCTRWMPIHAPPILPSSHL